jgi:hypothetical protein
VEELPERTAERHWSSGAKDWAWAVEAKRSAMTRNDGRGIGKDKNSTLSEGSCESRRVEKWKGKKLKSAARRYKGGTGALPVIN